MAAAAFGVDCHLHIIAPVDGWPMLASRSYTPAPATVSDWSSLMRPLGITHGVVVQPSFYGTDNRVLLAALRGGRGHLAGVAAVAPEVSDDELDTLVAAGVRGLRMAHFEPGDPRMMGGFVPLSALPALAPRMRRRGLHLQLFTDSRLLPAVAPLLGQADLPVVIDHMGRAPAQLGPDHPGLRALAELLASGGCWVKLSGLANLSSQGPGHPDVRALHERLLACREDRLLWGSDWPHTRPAGQRPCTATLLGLFRAWTPPALQQRILQDNPARLYGLAGG